MFTARFFSNPNQYQPIRLIHYISEHHQMLLDHVHEGNFKRLVAERKPHTRNWLAGLFAWEGCCLFNTESELEDFLFEDVDAHSYIVFGPWLQ